MLLAASLLFVGALCQSSLDGPSFVQPGTQSVEVDPGFNGPLSQRHGASTEVDSTVFRVKSLGFRQGSIWAPSTAQSIRNGQARNAELFGPILDAEGFSVECDQVSAAAVSILDVAVGPTNISGAVPKQGINPVEGKLFAGAWANFCIERLERISPLVAHRYSARSVVLEGDRVGVVAAREHRSPDLVFAALRHPVSASLPSHDSSITRDWTEWQKLSGAGTCA